MITVTSTLHNYKKFDNETDKFKFIIDFVFYKIGVVPGKQDSTVEYIPTPIKDIFHKIYSQDFISSFVQYFDNIEIGNQNEEENILDFATQLYNRLSVFLSSGTLILENSSNAFFAKNLCTVFARLICFAELDLDKALRNYLISLACGAGKVKINDPYYLNRIHIPLNRKEVEEYLVVEEVEGATLYSVSIPYVVNKTQTREISKSNFEKVVADIEEKNLKLKEQAIQLESQLATSLIPVLKILKELNKLGARGLSTTMVHVMSDLLHDYEGSSDVMREEIHTEETIDYKNITFTLTEGLVVQVT